MYPFRQAVPMQPHKIVSQESISLRNYPWRCLCFGFSQITLILPFLLMILHFSQMGFTDDLTFIVKILLSHLAFSVPSRQLGFEAEAFGKQGVSCY